MPTATYTALANLTLSTAAQTVNFTSINGKYKDLCLVTVLTSSISNPSYIRINNDSTANAYKTVTLAANGTGLTSTANPATSLMYLDSGGYTSSIPTLNITHFLDASSTDKFKLVLSKNNKGSAISTGQSSALICGIWSNTAAISSISITHSNTPGFSAGSTFALYGVIA